MKNLNHKPPLSRKELDALRRSGTVPSDLDDFDRDALEGFQKNQVSLGIMRKTDRLFLRSQFLILSSALLLVAGLGFGLWFYFDTEAPVKQAKQAHQQEQSIERSDYELPDSITDLKPISNKKIIHVKEIRAHFQDKKTEETQPIQSDEEPRTPVNALPKQKISPLESSQPELAGKSIFAKEIYVSDLKLVDYRAYRSKPAIKTEQIIISGTPANKEDKNSEVEELEYEKIEIPYYDYIKKTTGIFSEANYKKALYRYEEILATYPDDINANFYGGLCYFNLGKLERAKLCFRICISHGYLNFKEEAEWYLSKCYLAEGNKEGAALLLRKISEAGGFYAEQANKVIKTL